LGEAAEKIINFHNRYPVQPHHSTPIVDSKVSAQLTRKP